jgi:hypothetical protein
MKIRDMQALHPRSFYGIDVSIGSVLDTLEQFQVNLDPDYQRDHVWTPEQQEKYIGALIECPEGKNPIILNDVNMDGSMRPSDVIDGKQRITAMVAWLQGDIRAVCPCGETFLYDDLDAIDRRCVGMTTTLRWNWMRLDREGVLRYYLALNTGGSVHTEEEINKVKKMLENS